MQCEHNIYNISKQYIIMFDVWDSITSNSASDDGYDFSSKKHVLGGRSGHRIKGDEGLTRWKTETIMIANCTTSFLQFVSNLSEHNLHNYLAKSKTSLTRLSNSSFIEADIQ